MAQNGTRENPATVIACPVVGCEYRGTAARVCTHLRAADDLEHVTVARTLDHRTAPTDQRTGRGVENAPNGP